MPEDEFTSADFHAVAQKQIIHAVYETLVDSKLDWDLIEPLTRNALRLAANEFRTRARIRLHASHGGDTEEPSQEAFLAISVTDREASGEWLSEAYWLSDIAVADGDPAEVTRIIEAVERSLAKARDWLAQKDAGPGVNAEAGSVEESKPT